MRVRIGLVFGLIAFWLVAANAVAWAWKKYQLLYVVPGEMQRYFLGESLDPRTVRSQFSSYNYDGSGVDMWVYELSVDEADRLRLLCSSPTFIQFHDPRGEIKDEPLPACTFGSRGKPIDGQRYEDASVSISGGLVVLYRLTS